MMLELISLRFQTDPDLGAVEKLSISKPCLGMMGDVPKISIADIVDDAASTHMIPPLGVLFVKGWTRGIAALAIMACCYEDKSFLEAGQWC